VSDQDEATKHDKPARQSQPRIAQLPDFGPRYRVLAAIGKGGMGEVFRAYDTELKEEIAIKVVRDDHDDALARFRREIALARKVTSPNVLRVYDLAEHAGLRFLTMELVDGDDLAAVIRRDQRMPLERALAIFRQVCQGLAAAHAEGVVHRDLKPQNVLVDKDDRVRVADFGLARSIGESGLTASGAVLGSPAYMSPEQVTGDPTDERSDIYSLGIMLYQLVTGQTPFKADTPHAVMEMRLHKAPRPVHEVVPDVPPYVEAIVARCLEVDPDARFPTMAAVLTALASQQTAKLPPRRRKIPRWLVPAVAGALATAGIAVVAIAWPRSKSDEPVVAKPAVVTPSAPQVGAAEVLVLGIQNRVDDPLFDGTLDVVLGSALARSTKLDPVAGVSVRELANELDPTVSLDDALGKKLAERDHVRVIVVHGAIAPKGSAFTISMTAKDAVTGAVVVERSYDAATRDAVVPVMGRLASDLRESVGDPVAESERDKTGLSPVLAADHEYAIAMGMEIANDDAGQIAHIESALVKDPHFARGHTVLSVAYGNVRRESDAVEQSKLALREIDQLGDRDRLQFLGFFYEVLSQDYDRSIASYEQLLAKWPNDLPAATNVGVVYLAKGDVDKALEYARRCAIHHPRDVVSRSNYAEEELFAGHYEQAIRDIQEVIAEFPHPPESVWEYLAITQLLIGHRSDAAAAYADYAKADPVGGATALADFAMAEGRLHEAEQILTKAIAKERGKDLDDTIEIQEEMLAEIRLQRSDKAGARASAAHVSRTLERRFLAALVEVAAGNSPRALAVAKALSDDVAPKHRAYGKLVEAEALRVAGKPQQAMVAAQAAATLVNLPLAHFITARAALDAKLYPEALGEIETCLARKGFAVVSGDDVPLVRFLPQFLYLRARAQDGLGSSEAAAGYQAVLAMLHDPDPDDAMAADARKHVGK
jgi:Tfp pilus assembly protein PilF